MQKARSRLGRLLLPVAKEASGKSEATTDKAVGAQELRNKKYDFTEQKKPHSLDVFPILRQYLSHLPALICAFLGWWIIFYILTNIHPSTLRSFLLPNSYFLFLIIFFFANFFTWSFIFLNSRRGFILALGLTTGLFLKLQQVVFDPQLIIGFLTCWAMILSLNEFMARRFKS